MVADHRRILVVDDEPQITRVLRTSLSSQGYDIRVANNGETALEILKDWTPDLVITDLFMPNTAGRSLEDIEAEHFGKPHAETAATSGE